MSLRTAREMFTPGEQVLVTNHYIDREDHPCYGTRTATVLKSTTSGLTLEPGGHTPWPRARDIAFDGDSLIISGHPNEGDKFLTITPLGVNP